MASYDPLEPPRPLTPARKWLFRLILGVGVPLAVTVLLEVGLRYGGFGHDLNFFIPDDQPGFYRTNPRFTARFFPESFGLKPVNFRLSREKPAGRQRVFVLGESAAMGIPEPAFGLAPQLQAQLRAVQPDAAIDVYNLGVTAINSHAILPLLQQALEFHPDLLVIYMGNNEVVGPYGVAPLPRPLVRLSVAIRGSRTGQLLQRIVADLRGGARGYRDWRGMETFADKEMAADDPRLTRVRENFSSNLAAMLDAARAANVKVVLSTVAVNVRDCAPFVAEGSARATAALGWAAAREAAAREEWPQARELAARVLTGDPANAAAHFLLAVCLERTGDAVGARAEYFTAWDKDSLRFRAEQEINDRIRAAAQTRAGGVTLVDAARDLGSDPAALAPLPGRALFFEHVHFTWEGNYALARLLAPAAADALFGTTSLARRWLEPAACASAVGYTAAGRASMLQSMSRLTGRPPFTNQLTFATDRAEIGRQLQEANAALVTPASRVAVRDQLAAALAREPLNATLLYQAALAAVQAGDATQATDWLDQLGRAQPFSPEEAVLRALVLRTQGRANEAEVVLQRAITEEPYYFQSYSLLAQGWTEGGRAAQAKTACQQWLKRFPTSRVLRLTYAQVLAQAEDWTGVEEQWRMILRDAPDDEAALEPFLRRLVNTRRISEALDLVRAAFAANPRSLANNQRLVEYALAQGDAPQLVAALPALVESGPVPVAFFREQRERLRRLRELPEVRQALFRARQVTKVAGDTAALTEIEALLRD